MSTQIGIFVATMTGTAQMCAEEIETVLGRAGYSPEVHLMDDLEADFVKQYPYVVVVSSTYGHGDIPDNGQALFDSIQATDSLAGCSFAVFGLGDRTYAATFCEASQKWDALLAEKGAVRFAKPMQHDAAEGVLAEDVAGDWAAGWVPQLKRAA